MLLILTTNSFKLGVNLFKIVSFLTISLILPTTGNTCCFKEVNTTNSSDDKVSPLSLAVWEALSKYSVCLCIKSIVANKLILDSPFINLSITSCIAFAPPPLRLSDLSWSLSVDKITLSSLLMSAICGVAACVFNE